MPAPRPPALKVITAAQAVTALAEKRRRAPSREARSASHLERMEFAVKNIADIADTSGSREHSLNRRAPAVKSNKWRPVHLRDRGQPSARNRQGGRECRTPKSTS